MANTIRIQWKTHPSALGVVGDELYARAERIAAACGRDGIEPRRGTRSKRARAAVMAVTAAAIRADARDNLILRNVGAGRG